MLWRRFSEAIDDGAHPAAVSLAFRQSQFGRTSIIVAVPTPDDADLWYQWYADGQPDGQLTRDAAYGVGSDLADVVEVTALAFWSSDIEAWDYAPIATDSRASAEWFDSLDANAAEYVVQLATDDPPSTWVTAARVPRDGRWRYVYRTARQAGATVAVRVRSVSASGDDGSVVTVGQSAVAGRGDAPSVAVTFNSGTARITVSAA